jgi:5-methylcytosine-specific restriction endonuclease McrA
MTSVGINSSDMHSGGNPAAQISVELNSLFSPQDLYIMGSLYRQCECGKGFSSATGEVLCHSCRKAGAMDSSAARRRQREENAPGNHTEKQWSDRITFQNNLCFWCFRPLLSSQGFFSGTKDHLVPLARGGSKFIENIVAACSGCNRDKGTRTASEYQAVLAARAAKTSTVSSLPALKEASAFSFARPLLSTSAVLELRDPIFALSRERRVPEVSRRDIAARRQLLRNQVAHIQRLRLIEAGQMTLPMFGDGTAKELAESEIACMPFKGMDVMERKA